VALRTTSTSARRAVSQPSAASSRTNSSSIHRPRARCSVGAGHRREWKGRGAVKWHPVWSGGVIRCSRRV
jgi:hypothetical protein